MGKSAEAQWLCRQIGDMQRRRMYQGTVKIGNNDVSLKARQYNHLTGTKSRTVAETFTLSMTTTGNYADSNIYQDISRDELLQIKAMIDEALDHATTDEGF
jgi:hypothetical protein